jgi:hypothetical protein
MSTGQSHTTHECKVDVAVKGYTSSICKQASLYLEH